MLLIRDGSLAYRLAHFYENIGKNDKNPGYGDLTLKNETLGRFLLKMLIFLPFRLIFFKKVRISLFLVVILGIFAIIGPNIDQSAVSLWLRLGLLGWCSVAVLYRVGIMLRYKLQCWKAILVRRKSKKDSVAADVDAS